MQLGAKTRVKTRLVCLGLYTQCTETDVPNFTLYNILFDENELRYAWPIQIVWLYFI